MPDNKFKKSIIITKFSWSAIILNIWVEFLFVENNQARSISRKVVSNDEFFNLPQNQIAKGHLISKAIYGRLTSSKKRMDEFDLFTMKSKKANKTNSSVRFLEEVSRP